MLDKIVMWAIFGIIIVFLLALDLGIFNRESKHIPVRRALMFTALWISVAMAFAVFVYFEMGSGKAMEFLAAYVVEKAMSVDNIFLFLVIFSYFSIPDEHQHKALFYGVIGAIAFRALFIFLGAELLIHFHAVMYVFGIILVAVAFKTMFGRIEDGRESAAIRLSRFIKASPEPDGDRFFTVRDGVRMATPLFLCMIVIELSDIMFAFDSIPACLSITTDTFIVYTSNIFAILGLRSLYFALRGAMDALKYMKYGLGAILLFVGAKMLLTDVVDVTVGFSLAFILAVLALTAVASYVMDRRGRLQSTL